MAKSNFIIEKVNSSFESKCLTVLVKSYNNCIKNKSYSKDWEEKTFSSHLVSLMNKCDVALKYEMIITKEEELEDDEIDNGLKSADEANPIDIRFHNVWSKEERLNYIIEAKNISSSQWNKTNGSRVNASQQQTEYITKGVDRFLTGHFKDKRGCMLGYVVNGSLENIIEKVNAKISLSKNVSENILHKNMFIDNHKIFETKHSQKILKHLFFEFSN